MFFLSLEQILHQVNNKDSMEAWIDGLLLSLLLALYKYLLNIQRCRRLNYIALQKLWKMFLFHLKSSFRSRDIQIFAFSPSPLFLPVSHCLRAWSKINFKVHDAINCLNKNLKTHFVWYLEKERRYGIETLTIDTVLNKEHFCGKIMQKICTKS